MSATRTALAEEIDVAREFIGRLSVDAARAATAISEKQLAAEAAQRELVKARDLLTAIKSQMFVQKEKLARLFEQCFDEEHAR